MYMKSGSLGFFLLYHEVVKLLVVVITYLEVTVPLLAAVAMAT